jgi:broad specificity phosphatase PhoE
MHAFVRRPTNALRGWSHVVWIYLRTAWNHLGWRLQMRRQRSQPNFVKGSNETGMKQTLLFIRHGQSTWNAEHRLPGQLLGIDLDDAGRRQAARLADALSVLPISAIITSPLERARETAEILAEARHLPLYYEPELMDTNVGHFAGMDYNELRKSDEAWKAFVRNPAVAPPDVETFPQVQERSLAAVDRWRAKEGIGDYLAFVAHADIVKLLIAHYTGLDAAKAGSLFIDNASVSIVELEDEQRPKVVAIGWNPQPGWLKPPPPKTEQNGGVSKAEEE